MRRAYALLALVCTALAIVGLLLPGLPTTPFVLLAAWAANRGSPGLHRWLYQHRQLGPVLRDWDQQRAVRPSAKLLALAMLAVSWGVMAWRGTPLPVLITVTALFLAVGGFVATRPSPR